ncbi:small s protein [Nemania abortiva]|nr:small s protein [Nemania abortiva]
MSDPFSITAGAISVATAFTACIECFDYVQRGRHFGRDFQTSVILLSGAKLRLARWGEAVHVDRDPMLSKPDATSEETQVAKNALLQILMLFADTERIWKRHRLSAKFGGDLPVPITIKLDSATRAALGTQMKEMSIKRRKTSSLLKLTSWAIYDKSEFGELITSITALIENLERLFPPPQLEPPPASTQKEIAENWRRTNPRTPEDAFYKADNRARAAIAETLPGHRYNNVAVDGSAQIGDTFSDTWRGVACGVSHRYDDVFVRGNGRAVIGNKFGGKSFWDS